MYRIVAFTIATLILLVIDFSVAFTFATGGRILVAMLLCIPGALMVWAMLTVRFDTKRRKGRGLLHRGATRDEYNPWIGGGLG